MTETSSAWFVYMLRCGDGSLYTGIATDVDRRLQEHQGKGGANKGAKYLKGRGPLNLVLAQEVANRSVASRLEYRIKSLAKADKELLVAGKMNMTALLEQM